MSLGAKIIELFADGTALVDGSKFLRGNRHPSFTTNTAVGESSAFGAVPFN